ncbi:hypothetical protein GE09DRAFT_1184841 [Coniochaeta sp. 2T2.1]|nr:hypothetical protein GE09DRAFT_1184841 [Coniochaeta sp. 2T2.1]
MGSVNMPSLDDDNLFLGDAINIATRPVHTRLNKLILLRLPLAIPPRADDPSLYIQGILHITPLYIAFESLWHSALHANDSGPDASPSHQNDSPGRPFPLRTQSSTSSSGPQPSPRIHRILDALYIPGLLRSSRLRSDLRSLTGWSDALLQSRLEEAATSSGRLGEVIAHIHRSASEHPHVLLAYAWVLYMALFSGGRFIRATLESAGTQQEGFWTSSSSSDMSRAKKAKVPVHGPLDFFHFPTPQDGEDLKHEFKARLADVGRLLTAEERGHIVQEAVCIFENLILVINQLDDVCHTKLADLNSTDASVLSPRSAGFRIRDSVIVTRERSYRAQQQRSQATDEEEEEEEDGDGEDAGTKRSSSSTSSSSSSSGSDSDGKAVDEPKPQGTNAGRQKSCHTVQLASSSPRAEKDDTFSRRLTSRTRSDSGSNFSNGSPNMDPELAERLARAMRFDPQPAVPERTTPSCFETRKQGGAVALPGNDGGADRTDGLEDGKKLEEEEKSQPRNRGDSTLARGIQVASALGVAVAAVVAYSRG